MFYIAKRIFCMVVAVGLLGLAGCAHKSQPPELPSAPPPVRGVWLSTVAGLDWPPAASLTAATETDRIRMQKQALTDALDEMVKTGINTVFFQIKPDATALWHSSVLPWSAVLTGGIGKDPGYDPLAFILSEAHKRGIKVHAWLNPYRVSMDTRPETAAVLQNTLSTSPASVYALHPDWIRTASDRFVLDPGLPEVRDWITSVVTEVVKNYPVDGIQFDDYFYYETPQSPLQDDATYRQYGEAFSKKAEWRRNNTLLMIKQVSAAVRALKPHVELGISPAGVWRNKVDDPLGSDTKAGAPAYDSAYADTRQWVKSGLLDYIAPQLYWPVGREIARYDVLVKWWSDAVKDTPTRLYIGMALYKVGTPSKNEPDWTVSGGVPELKRQLDLNDSLPEVSGVILFRQAYLTQPQTEEAVKYLKTRWFNPR
ncbi:family 10 glycosylhydrolase [Erwinia tracheiphila]|uniref:Glycosyl hydrolase n=1 Tax=Erwinia tracheiphila TaxID=65700 RepID=A0A0M2KI23_9GAMM|nr:glycoside hydrolase family 10 protein [Erwinia tracheiphila]KKF36666.1 glycosyl hydrolase [Erwinia tracheiphila]UIA88003.1 family 10 glycosylhydrolase [Erwinia tracheiphila]UIA96592.1 family 10 glycosylhydrolase [Erwinia tracheiphila]